MSSYAQAGSDQIFRRSEPLSQVAATCRVQLLTTACSVLYLLLDSPRHACSARKRTGFSLRRVQRKVTPIYIYIYIHNIFRKKPELEGPRHYRVSVVISTTEAFPFNAISFVTIYSKKKDLSSKGLNIIAVSLEGKFGCHFDNRSLSL